jgi:hypothetical protein
LNIGSKKQRWLGYSFTNHNVKLNDMMDSRDKDLGLPGLSGLSYQSHDKKAEYLHNT